MSDSSSFFALDPDLIMHTAEAAGFVPTGEFTQLNSYENRVFDLRLETPEPARLIAKFYRPGRWSPEAIQEEHDFLLDLRREGLPVVAPRILKNQKTLLQTNDMFVAFFDKIYGRMPDEFLTGDLHHVGQLLARLHNVGAQKRFRHRPRIDENPVNVPETLEEILSWVSPEVRGRYAIAGEALVEALAQDLDPNSFQRIHGDCHRGNLLRDKENFYLVDFDDTLMGPVVQDFWMLFSSDESQGLNQDEQDELITGYEELRQFPHEQLKLIPLLRGLRILNYAAWIARRWSDPSFPKLFPEFNTYRYWAEETEALERIVWGLRQDQ